MSLPLLLSQADTLVQSGQLAEAIPLYAEYLALAPNDVAVLNSYGCTLGRLGRFSEALDCFDRALAIHPAYSAALWNKGFALNNLQPTEAIALYDEYLAQGPNNAAAWNSYGHTLADLGRFSEALDCFNRALAINPAHSSALRNKGAVLNHLQQWEQALACLDECVRLTPDFAMAHSDRGNSLLFLHRYEAAIESFCHATKLAPDLADAHWKEGICRLRMGDYDIGWKKHEWRGQTQTDWLKPQWRGEPIAGKRVLLWGEQGFGDVFQFCRYVRLVRDLGATVFLWVRPEVERLFQSVFAQENITIVLGSAQAEPFDFQCPLMSLPLACGTDSVAKIPANIPYLFADAVGVQHWHQRLLATGGARKRRVGLVWAGALAYEIDLVRSLHLRELAPLEAVQTAKGIQFFSLQLDAPAKQLAQMQSEGWRGPAIIDLTQDLHDWADTAALIANLDLVISCDTAVAHLAAAMGKPTWILSRYNGCWRWLADRTDSPWYPSVRLFRQPTHGDWETVMQEVARALAE